LLKNVPPRNQDPFVNRFLANNTIEEIAPARDAPTLRNGQISVRISPRVASSIDSCIEILGRQNFQTIATPNLLLSCRQSKHVDLFRKIHGRVKLRGKRCKKNGIKYPQKKQ
jgi:hypothetical protein